MEITSQQAITAHKEGKFKEAEHLYREILKTEPSNIDANNNLGVLLYNLSRSDESEVLFKKVIKLKPNYAEAYYNLGLVLFASRSKQH